MNIKDFFKKIAACDFYLNPFSIDASACIEDRFCEVDMTILNIGLCFGTNGNSFLVAQDDPYNKKQVFYFSLYWHKPSDGMGTKKLWGMST